MPKAFGYALAIRFEKNRLGNFPSYFQAAGLRCSPMKRAVRLRAGIPQDVMSHPIPDPSTPLSIMAPDAPWKLDPRIRRQIRITAAQIVGKVGFTKQDREDLEQELLVYLISRLDSFDARRSSPLTFVTRLLSAAASNIITARCCEKRDWRTDVGSLDETVEDEDGGCLLPAYILDFLVREGERAAVAERAKHDLRMDLDRFLSTLSELERQACLLIMKKNAHHAARRLGLPRASLYDLMVRLRERCAAFGLKKYL